MHPALQALLAHGPILSDGAWGTQLQARGLPIGETPDWWNLSQAAAVESVAAAYVAAGSRIILTNTFGASRQRLGVDLPAARLAEVNAAGVACSRAAAGTQALVYASIGPSGKLLITEEVTPEALTAAFAEQAQALAAAGADGLVVETMEDLDEAVLAVQAAAATGLPVIACMSFSRGAAFDRTQMGVTPEQAVPALLAAGAAMIGANCGVGPAEALGLCRRLSQAAGGPVWLKPNAGLPRLQNGQTVYDLAPEAFAQAALKLVAAGAGIVGGCCGTSPAHLQALAKALRG